MELKGKNALITGAAHRVGKAIALRLAQEGCNIALHYHRAAEEAEQALAEIRELGVRAHTNQADLCSLPAIKQLFRDLEKDFKRLDILINSAAIMQRKPFAKISGDDWAATIDLNLRAAFFCTQSAVQLMGSENGAIINISDIAGIQPWKDFPVHSISKAGIEMLTRVAALEYGPGVRVNAIAPGPVLKPEHMTDERWAQIGKALPLGKTGDPVDVARAVIFLLSNDYITGESLAVDGGNQLI